MSSTRRLILNALLVSLALAALGGVTAIFTDSDGPLKVTLTAFTAAGAALLLLWFSSFIDHPMLHRSGLLGVAAVGVNFLLVSAAIWDVPQYFGGGYREEDHLMGTAWIVAGWAFAGMLLLRLASSSFGRVAGHVGLGLAGLSLLTVLLQLWVPWEGRYGSYDYRWRFGELTLLIVALGPVPVACLLGLTTPLGLFAGPKPAEQGSLRHWRWVGITAAAFAIIGGAMHILSGSSSGHEELFRTLVTVAGFVAFAHLVTMAPLTQPQRWFGFSTLAMGSLCAAAMIGSFLTRNDDGLGRIAGATGLLSVCGSLALLVLALINRRTQYQVKAVEHILLAITCPRCRRPQQLPSGKAACGDCGLRFELRVEEPRCIKCGYMLYMSTEDHCPECGSPIVPQSDGFPHPADTELNANK